MKGFLLRILWFICSYLAVRTSIELLAPYYLGNDYFEKKLQILQEQGLKPTVLFFGTSRVDGQVDPMLFDSVFAASVGSKDTSYNMGIFMSRIQESIHLARNMLHSDVASRCKTVFIEMNIETNISAGGLKDKERACYWLDPSNYMVLSKCIMSQKWLSTKEKLNQQSGLTRLLFNRYLGFDRFRMYFMKEDSYPISLLETQVRGHKKVDEAEDKHLRAEINKQRESLDTSRLRRIKSKMEQESGREMAFQSPAMTEQLNAFIEEAAQSGVRVVYISMPPFRSELERSVSGNLKPGHYLDLADPYKYPVFFESSAYFDNTHLNGKGSRIMSCILADEYARMSDNGRQPLKHDTSK